MSDNVLAQYDPFLVDIGKMLDPGRWWSEGPVGYVSSMYDSRSYDDRAVAAVKNAERLLRHLAGAISGDAALPDFFEGAINDRITKALYDEHDKQTKALAAKDAEIEELKSQIELSKTSASSFLDLAGDGDIFEEADQAFGSNPLMDDLVRAGPLTPRRDIALVDVGPEKPAPTPPVNFELTSPKIIEPALKTLVTVLRKAQYVAEPLSFEINASVRLHPKANKDDSIATINLTVQDDKVSHQAVWLDPDRPTDKYEQVFEIIKAGAKDVGGQLTKLTT